MDITAFIASKRDRALLVGSYDTYRSQLSSQLHAIRKRLGRTTPKNAKFAQKAPVTAEDIGRNHEYVHLLLVQAERAWAHAMHIKSTHAEDNASKGISGVTRRHIISKLHKAAGEAKILVDLLADRSATKATDNDSLEAQAYALYLSGSEDFERQVTKSFEDVETQKQAWKACLQQFCEAHVIYSALLFSTQKEVFREFIGGKVDPSIRYAAYQSKLPRTVAVPTVAKRTFRQDEQKDVLSMVKKLNPNALSEETAQKATALDGASSVVIPTSINWRQRNAPISDAAVGQALAGLALAGSKLSTHFAKATESRSAKLNKPQRLAAAYDPVLNSAQDAVDAVRRSISDLAREGVAESDSRMQDLRVSDLAVNYSLVSWRIGRNRVLIGGSAKDDGATFMPDTNTPRKAKSKPQQPDSEAMDIDSPPKAKTESVPHVLARLTTRTVLLDSTLQSIDSLSSLPGAARDSSFQAELTAQRAYYQALKCITIAYSHKTVARSQTNDDEARRSSHANALALFVRANDILGSIDNDNLVNARCTSTPGLLADHTPTSPPTLLITTTSLSTLRTTLTTLTRQQRGLCALHHYQSQSATAAAKSGHKPRPLVETLDTYPASGKVDLSNLVTYPPEMEMLPVKPIFLDLAWNYIEYPSRAREGEKGQESVVGKAAGKVAEAVGATATGSSKEKEKEDGTQKKRGWFGFGRS